jgi:hypothetical protein
MFNYKIFGEGSDKLLAISDSSLVGKSLEEGEISLTVSKDFYGEETCGENEIKKLIKSVTIINAIGKKIVSVLEKENLVNKKNVLYVNGVPHAQVVII